MNKEMLDLCAWVIKTAKAAGADACMVNLDATAPWKSATAIASRRISRKPRPRR